MPPSRKGRSTVKSKRIVIDASILRAAGSIGAVHPTASQCRDVLQAVLTICHRAALSADLKVEWNQHQSQFARNWRTAMYARGKVIDVPVGPPVQAFGDRRVDVPFSEVQRQALEKDTHLVMAAAATDHTILSLDNSMRVLLNRLPRNQPETRRLLWINPTTEHDQAMAFLRGDAKPVDVWRFGR